jgi:His-Xaa-Ser system radical SAM maturase HxsC
MRYKFASYQSGHKVVSVSRNKEVFQDLLESGLDFLHFESCQIFLYPQRTELHLESNNMEALYGLDNYDICEIFEDGYMDFRFDASRADQTFFVTGRCNSGCIMCPSADAERKKGEIIPLSTLLLYGYHLPDNLEHITVTGGEPFMLRQDLFTFLAFLKRKFPQTDVLILTNGRIFSVPAYVTQLKEAITDRYILGIPVHASCSQIHDEITQASGSFIQTIQGIKNLLEMQIRVELRIVVSAVNAADLENLAWMIVHELPSIEYVSIIAMEMTGNARINAKRVWISYKESFDYLKRPILILLEHGIDVKLYNYPLCTVPKEFHTLCEKSISDYKIRFKKECDACALKDACGGIFAGTWKLEQDELRPII